MSRVTAETITDDQIRELREQSYLRDHENVDPNDDLTYVYCRIALGTMRGNRAKARARCAEILNARSAK